MTDPALRKRLAALVIAAGFVLAGCSDSAALGPCTLRVGAFDRPSSGGSTALNPPYRVAVSGRGHQRGLTLSGAGWSVMNVELRSPSGGVTNDQLDAQAVRGRGNEFQLSSPGQWHVRLSDPVSGCVREFAVEAVE